ncbi:hypothetical protein [Chitinophaga sp. CF418]|nr:hypothetical protein [Chitinophaga sp. CF418]
MELAEAVGDEKRVAECNGILQQLGLKEDELLLINKRYKTM